VVILTNILHENLELDRTFTPTTNDPARDEFIRVTNLTKRFGNFTALGQVDFSVYGSEVHAVLGENGAGKSTLMKLLYGVYTADEGNIHIHGRQMSGYSPAIAKSAGIGMVFQDFRLIPALTVWENISLSLPREKFWLRRGQLIERIRQLSARYDLDVKPEAFVWELDLGQRQRVEIMKALMLPNAKVIILDEPTSVLTPQEVEAFLAMVARLRADGYGMILITHKIKEVLACADRVTVLRHGKVCYTENRREALEETVLVSAMMGGQQVPVIGDKEPAAYDVEPILRLNRLSIVDDHGRLIVEPISMDFYPGEIIGVAGISGNGQREWAETLYGQRQPYGGEIFVGGRKSGTAGSREMLQQGVVYCPEDPIADSIVPGLTVLEHMVLAGLPMIPKRGDTDWRLVRDRMKQVEAVHTLRVAEPERMASSLSGGNIQRMILARALSRDPQIMIVAYPTRGLDIATAKATHQLLLKARQTGTLIILISEELTELFELSDRIVVLSQKKAHGPILPAQTDPYEIGKLMTKGDDGDGAGTQGAALAMEGG
jgi:ABC-type uncharacterized transport system ATPase subunit